MRSVALLCTVCTEIQMQTLEAGSQEVAMFYICEFN